MDVKLPPDQVAVLTRLAAALERLAAVVESATQKVTNGNVKA
jgi:hypothetical protein